MGLLRIQEFGAVIPVSGDRALPNNYATQAFNTWLYGKELRGIRPPEHLIDILAATRRVLRIPRRNVGGDPTYPTAIPPPSYLGDSTWMQWTDIDTDVVKGQLAEDRYERWYFCSPTTGPQFNTYARMQAGSAPYNLGVPGPMPILPAVTVVKLYKSNPAKVEVSALDIEKFFPSMVVEFAGAAGAGMTGANGNHIISSVDRVNNTFLLTNVDTSSAAADITAGMTIGTFQPTISSITGGAAPVVTRSYTYTWVNEFGEESCNAPPVTGAGNTGATWNIADISDPPTDLGAVWPAWKKKYLYRTSSGTDETTFYRVAEIPIGTTTYADNTTVMTDANLVLKQPLESTSWMPPPDNLQGWIAMPNGFLIGFDKAVAGRSSGNNIWMSEPYLWHAWPPAYKYATETPIVGLGVLGQTCVVCTQGYPASVTGSKPAACTFQKSSAGEPCMSRGSIVSTPQGVLYASQNGLILIGAEGIQNITQQLITREEWVKDYAPQFLRAVRYQNGYLALRMFPPPRQPDRSGFFLDTTDLRVALTEITDFEEVVALNVDFWSGEVFVLKAGEVSRWDPSPPTPATAMMPVKWVSKEFQYPFQENFGAYAVFWDEARASHNDWGLGIMPNAETCRVRVYADRTLVYDQAVPRNERPNRLPSGFKAYTWKFEICSRAPVFTLHVGSTMKELKGA